MVSHLTNTSSSENPSFITVHPSDATSLFKTGMGTFCDLALETIVLGLGNKPHDNLANQKHVIKEKILLYRSMFCKMTLLSISTTTNGHYAPPPVIILIETTSYPLSILKLDKIMQVNSIHFKSHVVRSPDRNVHP